MGEGFDQLGKKNMMRINEDKRKVWDEAKKEKDQKEKDRADGETKYERDVKMDEYTSLITNIVYARDPRVFNTKSGYVNQRVAFVHENLLDIKALIKI